MSLKILLWPEICPFCFKASAGGICKECRKKTDGLRIRGPVCLKCGKPVRYKEQEYCHDCGHTYHYYDRGAALWLHREPVSTSVYRFKYQNQRVFAKYYAGEMAAHMGELVRRWRPEVLVPVPLHPRRRRKRGYNQAALLARELGSQWGLPVGRNLVRRVRYTEPQKELNPGNRKKNLESAFAPGRAGQMPRSVLVIDDIYTTGSTADAVAKVLKEAGVQKVYFLCISIGQGY